MMSEEAHSEETNHQAKPRRKTISSSARRFLLLILITYLMCLAPLTYYQRSLIYHPRRTGRLMANQAGLPQATVDVTVKSYDGLDLHGWIALAGVSSSSESVDLKQTLANGRPVVLFFPGNAGDRTMRHLQMATLGSLNAHVVLVDYRGFADNLGKPTEENFARDARSVWNHLTGELGVAPHRIVIYGESLGGGSATRLASDLCQEGIEPGGLIEQSTFSSLVAVAQVHFPIIPVSLLLVDRFPSDVRIRHVTCPILQIHGKIDSVVPFSIGQQLFDAAPEKSSRGIAKKQLVMPHTDHNDVYSEGIDSGSMVRNLGRFLDEVASAPEPELKPTDSATKPVHNPVAAHGVREFFDWTIVATIVIVLLAVLAWWMLREKPLPKQ